MASNQKPALEKDDLPLALLFDLEPYEASFPIEDLKGFALTVKKEEKQSIPNWIEGWFEGFNWAGQGLSVKHNKEYDKLPKISPEGFMEWLDKQAEEGKVRLKCRIFKDLKDGVLCMTRIEGVDMEAWGE